MGSTRVLTDELGVVTDSYSYDSYSYDAYGTVTASTGTTQNSYLYAGEQFDKGLNQYYLRDRYYGTDIGRFTQRDRFEGDMMQPLSLNRYGYTHGNPVNAIDPSGMFVVDTSSILSLMENLAFQYTSYLVRTGTTIGRATTEVGTAVGAAYYAIGTYIYEKIFEQLLKLEVGIGGNGQSLAGLGYPILVHGFADMAEHATHINDAESGYGFTINRREDPRPGTRNERPPLYNSPQAIQLPPLLHKGFGRYRSDPWLEELIPREGDEIKTYYGKPRNIYPNWSPPKRGFARDEYPFASTKEGGEINFSKGSVSVKVVSIFESNRQRDLIRNFYRKNSMSTGSSFGSIGDLHTSARSGWYTASGEWVQF